MEIQWLVQKLAFIANELSHFRTNLKLIERCALLWKLCNHCQIWNCQVNDGENCILLSQTGFFSDLGTCLPYFSVNLAPIWVRLIISRSLKMGDHLRRIWNSHLRGHAGRLRSTPEHSWAYIMGLFSSLAIPSKLRLRSECPFCWCCKPRSILGHM